VPDDRGWFITTYQQPEVEAALGRPLRRMQGNHSRSHAGVLRGFRLEPWDKFIYVAHGTALVVVADPRPESPTFGQSRSFLLGDAPGGRHRVFVAEGLANAFLAITECDYLNEVGELYVEGPRKSFAWNDPTIAFPWPTQNPVLSPKDAQLPTLLELLESQGS
jgi:dTDP-4-dehydrorhamnose 3,5-epimerase